jgi:hypothetical protein
MHIISLPKNVKARTGMRKYLFKPNTVYVYVYEINELIISDIFLQIQVPESTDLRFGRRGVGITYTDVRKKKRFRNAVLACVLQRKNLRNGIPARSVTKIPLIITISEILQS